MHRKRLNEHIREHNHWGCALCVWVVFVCTPYNVASIFYSLCNIHLLRGTWNCYYSIEHSRYKIWPCIWLGEYALLGAGLFKCSGHASTCFEMSRHCRRKWIIDQREKFHLQPPICTINFSTFKIGTLSVKQYNDFLYRVVCVGKAIVSECSTFPHWCLATTQRAMKMHWWLPSK